jgi:anti-anti-sigma regulatory factor
MVRSLLHSAVVGKRIAADLAHHTLGAPMTHETPGSVHLPPSLDLSEAELLCRELRAQILAAETIVLEGSQVERVSTPCLQILLAAFKSSESRGLSFRLDAPSKVLTDALADLGLEQSFAPARG